MANSETSELVERAFRDYNEGGVEALLPYVHPDFVMTTTSEIAAEPDTYEGHDGLRRYFGSFLEIMDKVEIHPTSVEPQGDRALIRFDLVARGGATGIETTQKGFQIATLEDGLLRRIDFFASDEQVVAAFDASPG